MTQPTSHPIASVAELLAHAMELEIEARERYRDLADTMAIHNNPEVAELFRRLAGYSAEHAREVADLAQGHDLPRIAPWDFKWRCPEAPESQCQDQVDYLMTPHQALTLALHNELRARDFYAEVARGSPDPEARRLAQGMADEEDTHAGLIRVWLANRPPRGGAVAEDMDPPNEPG